MRPTKREEAAKKIHVEENKIKNDDTPSSVLTLTRYQILLFLCITTRLYTMRKTIAQTSSPIKMVTKYKYTVVRPYSTRETYVIVV